MIITLAFKKSATNPSLFEKIQIKSIQYWTKSPYYHVEMIIKDFWVSSNPDVGGVKIHPLKELSKNYDYIDINVDGRKLKSILKFINKQKGKKYDWVGIIFSQVIKADIEEKDKWFCSEIVAKILKLFGLLLELDCNQYSPGLLYDEILKLSK